MKYTGGKRMRNREKKREKDNFFSIVDSLVCGYWREAHTEPKRYCAKQFPPFLATILFHA